MPPPWLLTLCIQSIVPALIVCASSSYPLLTPFKFMSAPDLLQQNLYLLVEAGQFTPCPAGLHLPLLPQEQWVQQAEPDCDTQSLCCNSINHGACSRWRAACAAGPLHMPSHTSAYHSIMGPVRIPRDAQRRSAMAQGPAGVARVFFVVVPCLPSSALPRYTHESQLWYAMAQRRLADRQAAWRVRQSMSRVTRE